MPPKRGTAPVGIPRGDLSLSGVLLLAWVVAKEDTGAPLHTPTAALQTRSQNLWRRPDDTAPPRFGRDTSTNQPRVCQPFQAIRVACSIVHFLCCNVVMSHHRWPPHVAGRQVRRRCEISFRFSVFSTKGVAF